MNPNESSIGRLVRNNLVALGSAAVLTVYSAGYLRTRSAAQRFAAADAAERRPVASAPRIAGDPASHALQAPAVPQDVAGQPVSGPPAPASKASPANGASAPAARSTDSTRAANPETTPVPAAPPPKEPSGTTGNGQVADTTAQRQDSLRPQYRDGVFAGWGTSRHGDIQATVEIKDGRIASAYISGCYTRYSCSWISMLPPQVVARQSAEVDYVSGATQSTNAFYWAVIEALKQAK